MHECITCFLNKPIVVEQLTGDLPKERVTIDYPFNCLGVDLCGPFTSNLIIGENLYNRRYMHVYLVVLFLKQYI